MSYDIREKELSDDTSLQPFSGEWKWLLLNENESDSFSEFSIDSMSDSSGEDNGGTGTFVVGIHYNKYWLYRNR